MSQSADSTQVTQWYVVYVDGQGEYLETHGGPYTPQKSREVRDAMQSHIDRVNYSDWSIPQDTTTAKRVAVDDYPEFRRKGGLNA